MRCDTLPKPLDDYREFLLRLANRQLDARLRSKVSSSDLVQRTLLLACQKFETFQGATEAEFKGWLSTILRNQCINETNRYRNSMKRHFGRERAGLVDQLPSHEPSLSSVILRRETIMELLKAIEELPADQREIVRLRYVEQQTLEQISDRMLLSRHATTRRLTAALKRLGELLREAQ